jgi:hypothetical protein
MYFRFLALLAATALALSPSSQRIIQAAAAGISNPSLKKNL